MSSTGAKETWKDGRGGIDSGKGRFWQQRKKQRQKVVWSNIVAAGGRKEIQGGGSKN